ARIANRYFTTLLSPYALYDFNGDNVTDNLDTIILLRAVTNITASSSNASYDLNGDGVVNNLDLIKLKKYITSLYDYDSNGSVGNSDITILLRVVTHVAGFSCPSNRLCDINHDGVIDNSDLIKLKNLVSLNYSGLVNYDLNGDGVID